MSAPTPTEPLLHVPYCPGWGDGRDGGLCDGGYEASVWTGKAMEPKRKCPTCGGGPADQSALDATKAEDK